MPVLTTLLKALPTARVQGDGDPDIRSVACDSRQVQPGALFCCVPGQKTDGRRYLAQAVASGAAAALAEAEVEALGVPVVFVPSVRAAMPVLAAECYGRPARRLALVGVTGTNGKTTTTYLIEAIARYAGRSAGVIGTIGARLNGEDIPGERTTPEGPDLQALLQRMAAVEERVERIEKRAGAIRVSKPPVIAMEVSSHALEQGRTLGCEFDVSVFTNLTQDHLDYHGDMEAYYAAKRRLFVEYPAATRKASCAVINVDDPYGRRLRAEVPGRILTFGIEQEADLRASDVSATSGSLVYRLSAPEGEFLVRLGLGGLFNVANSLGAIGAARALGFPWEVILGGLGTAAAAPGRFESVDAGQAFGVLVDYAHTPDGLENVLRSARALAPRRLIAVFGCGGDRDRTKRPLMGRIAGKLSDHVVVTSDNPRTEDPEAIVQEVAGGLPPGAACDLIVDRRAAIRAAIQMADVGDLVVIAGKGHETYQIFADRMIHFDDREEARVALRARPAP